MIVSRRTHESAMAMAEGVRLDFQSRLTRAEQEIKRLTTVIIQLKEQRMELPPEHGVERWPGGSYSMEDAEKEAMRKGEYDTDKPFSVDDDGRVVDDPDYLGEAPLDEAHLRQMLDTHELP